MASETVGRGEAAGQLVALEDLLLACHQEQGARAAWVWGACSCSGRWLLSSSLAAAVGEEDARWSTRERVRVQVQVLELELELWWRCEAGCLVAAQRL